MFGRKQPQQPPEQHTGIGYAVINGYRLDATLIEMRESQIVVHLHGSGPCTLEGPITLIGADGYGIGQGLDVPRREIAEGARVYIPVKLRIGALNDEKPFIWR